MPRERERADRGMKAEATVGGSASRRVQSEAPAAHGLLQLQRTIGNRAVCQLVQRNAVGTDGETVVLDGSKSKEECANAIAQHMVATRNGTEAGDQMSVQEIASDALKVLQADAELWNAIASPTEKLTMAEVAARVNAHPVRKESVHNDWLVRAQDEWKQTQDVLDHLPLVLHEATQQGEMAKTFDHFNLNDTNMLWRFTHTPSKEFIKIEKGVSYEEILKVVAAHSGGNDKSNPNVKTLSFGRNLAALLGTAASAGGDKKVTNIIDKAAYLYGIDIGSLGPRGISAHPARGRLISLFESEYVLVATPGAPPVLLDELATVKYQNPFYGRAALFTAQISPSTASIAQLKSAIKSMGKLEPEVITGLQQMPRVEVDEIYRQARAVRDAAQELSMHVMNKEAIPLNSFPAMEKLIQGYAADIRKRLQSMPKGPQNRPKLPVKKTKPQDGTPPTKPTPKSGTTGKASDQTLTKV